VSQTSQRQTKKKGVIVDSPFLHWLKRLNLELISPVQIAVQPLATRAYSASRAARITTEVVLYGGRQVGSIVPQQMPTDAHSRRDEVPQIPFADYINTPVELTTVDGGSITSASGWSIARDVRTLKVRTHQDGTRGIR
jgi:hypothetical protein